MDFNHSWDSSQYTKTSDLQADVAGDLIKNLRIKHDECILDVGCGIGNISIEIAAIANNGYVVGIDDSSAMIDQACKNLSFKDLRNINFQVMSATEMKFYSHFDVVFSNSVLHWIKKQDMVLQSIYRCLKPGGRIGLQFPILNTSHPMVRLVEKAIHSLRLENKYTNWESPWYVPKSRDAYTDLLAQNHFKKITVKEVGTFYTFETALAVIGFFNSVGIDLLLQPISNKDGISVKNEIIKILESNKIGNGIKLEFHRLYAQASL